MTAFFAARNAGQPPDSAVDGALRALPGACEASRVQEGRRESCIIPALSSAASASLTLFFRSSFSRRSCSTARSPGRPNTTADRSSGATARATCHSTRRGTQSRSTPSSGTGASTCTTGRRSGTKASTRPGKASSSLPVSARLSPSLGRVNLPRLVLRRNLSAEIHESPAS